MVHRWTGLTVGLLVVFLALTGLTLVFRPQLEPVVSRDLMAATECAEPLALDALLAKARTVHPKVALDMVKIVKGESTVIRFADKIGVHVDPCTGAVLGEQHRWSGLFNTLEWLHRFRFIDSADVGNFITGSAALAAAFVFAIGGLVVWWPPTLRALKRSLRLLPNLTGRAFELNLHRTVGLYVSLVILVAALASLPIAFKWARYGLTTVTGSTAPAPRPPSAKAADDARRAPLQTCLRNAQALVPRASEILILYARKKGDRIDSVEVQMIGPDAPHPNAHSKVYLDAFTGNALLFEPYAQSGAGNRIYRWLNSLHMGYIGGVFGQILLFTGVLGVPVLGYTGVSSYLRRRSAEVADKTPGGVKMRVKRIRPETAEIKSFELVSATRAPLPEYTPGSHIDVHIDDGLTRQYSLCNGPMEKDCLVIAVKREPESRGGSRAMHERIAEGDLLTISPPRNHFSIDPSATRHLLLAGGIGITPLLSMARHLLHSGGSFHLQYFTRSVEHTAFHAVLSQPEFRGKVTFHYAVDPQGLHTYLQKLLWHREEGTHLYVCGPRPFMDLVEATASATWPPGTVHAEHFSANPMAFSGPREAFEVKLALSGGSYEIPADRTIVSVLADYGIEIPTSCEQGVCGTCLCGVLEGTPDHRDAFLTEDGRKAGDKMLPCVSRAKGKLLVLDI